jgi:hypothetical protein
MVVILDGRTAAEAAASAGGTGRSQRRTRRVASSHEVQVLYVVIKCRVFGEKLV